jgi:uncharacterized protein
VNPHWAPVPDAWPPSAEGHDRTATAPVVPLFPLPNFFLFPGTKTGLHIFEPRYRQMIEDCLDGPGRIVVSPLLEGWIGIPPGPPPVLAVAGLGEIASHERLPDGRFMIWLVGLARVELHEVASDRLYRKVEIRPLPELPAPAGAEARLRPRLAAAVGSRAPEVADRLGELPLGQLTDLLLMTLQLPQSCMQDLYSRLAVAERAERALQEHAQRPVPPRRHQSGNSG